jgi:hypothetical protein
MTKTQTPLPSQSEAFKNMITEMWRQYEAAKALRGPPNGPRPTQA